MEGGSSPGGAYLEADLAQFLLSVGGLGSFFLVLFWLLSDAGKPRSSLRCNTSVGLYKMLFLILQRRNSHCRRLSNTVSKHSGTQKLGCFSLELQLWPTAAGWALRPLQFAVHRRGSPRAGWAESSHTPGALSCLRVLMCSSVFFLSLGDFFYCWIQNKNFTQ